MIKVGQPFPDFRLANQDGRERSLADYRGRWLVLYFYPKDMTPGCTRQACAFRDEIAAIGSRGAEVVGVSPDSAAKHAKFATKESLPFPLLSDPTNDISSAYGVWRMKKLYGREYMGVVRTTFIIDEGGRIAHIFPKVAVDRHALEVIAAIDRLSSEPTGKKH